MLRIAIVLIAAALSAAPLSAETLQANTTSNKRWLLWLGNVFRSDCQ
ncbi:MAG: hypothetical protein ACRD5Z_22730 [Bryobacteraceae bacterium]